MPPRSAGIRRLPSNRARPRPRGAAAPRGWRAERPADPPAAGRSARPPARRLSPRGMRTTRQPQWRRWKPETWLLPDEMNALRVVFTLTGQLAANFQKVEETV